jgi:hypothetical protein
MKINDKDILYKPKVNYSFGPLEYKRCEYCRDIMRQSMGESWYKKGFCSEWCYEMENPPKIEHTCKTCHKVVKPFKRYSGYNSKYYVSSGVYPKYCPKHTTRGVHKKI